MKIIATLLVAAASAANIEIVDDANVRLNLFHWIDVEDATLYFQARFESK